MKIFPGNHSKNGREITRGEIQPSPDLIHRKEGSGLDLPRCKTEGSLGGADKDLEKFLTSFITCLDLPKPDQLGIDTDLLSQFPMCGLLIALAGINMPRRAGAPEVGMVLLPRGALLEKKLPPPVEQPDVNGPVTQVVHMHCIPGHGTDHLIPIIHDVENFSGGIDLRMFRIARMESKFGPIVHGEILRPCRDRISFSQGPLLPCLFRQIKE